MNPVEKGPPERVKNSAVRGQALEAATSNSAKGWGILLISLQVPSKESSPVTHKPYLHAPKRHVFAGRIRMETEGRQMERKRKGMHNILQGPKLVGKGQK